MHSMTRCWCQVAVIALFGPGAGVPSASAEQSDKHGKADPGCASRRPAIAHRAGGVAVVPDQHDRAPIACSVNTGWRTSETAILVTNEGTVVFEPALTSETTGLPIGLLRSADEGANWEFVDPSPPAIQRVTAQDTTMAVDRDTGRLFWNTSSAAPFGSPIPYVDRSDDDGRTWTSSKALPVLFDDAHVFTGPPSKALKHQMQAYPNVVYVAVSGGFTCSRFGFCGTHVTRSRDGGESWDPAVGLPFPPECPLPGALPMGGYLGYGLVAKDGTVYLPFTPCERPYVAISHDSGATWQLSLVANVETIGYGAMPLGMDREGNLYAAWAGSVDRLLYMAKSHDHGSHWSAPLMIAAPGVTETAVPQLVAGARGQVAVAYYGSVNAPRPFPTPCPGFSLGCPGYEHETWNTYVTESWNGLDAHPLFWSASLNDPAHPTWYGVSPSAMRVGDSVYEGGSFGGGVASGGFAAVGGPSFSGRMDYFGAAMGPDDTAWVGFIQECPRGMSFAGNPNCPSGLQGTAPDAAFGMVGRLVAAPAHADDD